MDQEEGMLPRVGRITVQEGQEEMSIIKVPIVMDLSPRNIAAIPFIAAIFLLLC
jgi:hypothetical protein